MSWRGKLASLNLPVSVELEGLLVYWANKLQAILSHDLKSLNQAIVSGVVRNVESGPTTVFSQKVRIALNRVAWCVRAIDSWTSSSDVFLLAMGRTLTRQLRKYFRRQVTEKRAPYDVFNVFCVCLTMYIAYLLFELLLYVDIPQPTGCILWCFSRQLSFTAFVMAFMPYKWQGKEHRCPPSTGTVGVVRRKIIWLSQAAFALCRCEGHAAGFFEGSDGTHTRFPCPWMRGVGASASSKGRTLSIQPQSFRPRTRGYK